MSLLVESGLHGTSFEVRVSEPEVRIAEFAQLYSKYCDSVRQIVRQVVGRSRHCVNDVDDVVQTSFLRLYRAIRDGRVTRRLNIGGYLATIARHAAIDWVVEQRRSQRLPELSDGQAASYQPSHAGPDVTSVQSYLSGLSAELKRVYVLRFEQQLSQQEAARKMGISRQQVRTLEGHLLRDGRHTLAR
jgi:RNA polymerase sigma factor (sigma-70 family)